MDKMDIHTGKTSAVGWPHSGISSTYNTASVLSLTFSPSSAMSGLSDGRTKFSNIREGPASGKNARRQTCSRAS